MATVIIGDAVSGFAEGCSYKQNTVSHLFGENNLSLDDYLLLLAQAFPGQVGWQPDFNAILAQQPDDATV